MHQTTPNMQAKCRHANGSKKLVVTSVVMTPPKTSSAVKQNERKATLDVIKLSLHFDFPLKVRELTKKKPGCFPTGKGLGLTLSRVNLRLETETEMQTSTTIAHGWRLVVPGALHRNM